MDTELADNYTPRVVDGLSIINRHNSAVVRNLALYPDRVVLDLREELKEFWEGVDKADDYELSVDDSLSEVLLYIGNIKDAISSGIPALGNDIKLMHARESGFRDGEILSEVMMNFGTAVFNKLRQFGAYTPEGVLPYHFDRHWIDSTSPCLVKSEDDGYSHT